MPSYKTHSIHGEEILKRIDKRIELDKEDLKTYCIGFDTLIPTEYQLFKSLHNNNTKLYFETIIKYIKDNKLQDNSEVISFLYGQLDHFILDISIHPLIYYMTALKEKEHLIDYHGLVEMWIDEYVMNKHHKNDKSYYHKWKINDEELKRLIREIYIKLFDKSNMVLKYDIGIISNNLYDLLIRENKIMVAPLICKLINIGDIIYKDDLERVKPYLNSEKEVWYNPETEEKLTKSFDDLWEESVVVSEEAIYDVNRHLYDDRPLTTRIIKDNLSANTGLPCEHKQKLKCLKRY